MTTREKIIVGLMILAIIYGVYTVFFAAPREAVPVSRGDKELATLNTFITKVAEKTKTGMSDEQSYILQKARAEWKQDPFVQIQPKLTREEQEERQPLVLKSKILYTGFMQMGDKQLAIINGMEYEVGDRLGPAGLVVRTINPNHVVLAAPDKKNKTVTLPMEEIE
jgi:hypothetical protein